MYKNNAPSNGSDPPGALPLGPQRDLGPSPKNLHFCSGPYRLVCGELPICPTLRGGPKRPLFQDPSLGIADPTFGLSFSHIYKIKNILTGDVYIGQSTAPNKRRGLHFSLHKNKKGEFSLPELYNDMVKYGKQCFIFGILEYKKQSLFIQQKIIEISN